MTYLPCDLLVKVDIASMAHGLEARSPFLDHKVVELAGKIPIDRKLRLTRRGLEGKLILKDTFGHLLPRPILTRRKMGFGVPIASWFRGELKELLHDVLLSRTALERGYFNPKQLEQLVNEHTSGVRDHGYPLWSLLMLELWHRRFVDGVGADL
jgi:asparagine synthase (glutamine-hydrolysing)